MFFMYPFLLCITSLAHFSCFVLFYSHHSHLYHLPLAHSLILKAYASAADPLTLPGRAEYFCEARTNILPKFFEGSGLKFCIFLRF